MLFVLGWEEHDYVHQQIGQVDSGPVGSLKHQMTDSAGESPLTPGNQYL